PESITIVPSEELVPKYEVDYSDMRSSFIYGEALEFADLLKFLETLQELFRKVPPKEKKG
ncbi:MAG: nucleotidyl transferase AbiEii/AbiGii toxin family protein, partial [Bacteroidales bacterium]|nr:nucleotidyl transferase AbiEii/AbiGii toxin family protein [Bacteroidales bacterium]